MRNSPAPRITHHFPKSSSANCSSKNDPLRSDTPTRAAAVVGRRQDQTDLRQDRSTTAGPATSIAARKAELRHCRAQGLQADPWGSAGPSGDRGLSDALAKGAICAAKSEPAFRWFDKRNRGEEPVLAFHAVAPSAPRDWSPAKPLLKRGPRQHRGASPPAASLAAKGDEHASPCLPPSTPGTVAVSILPKGPERANLTAGEDRFYA